MLVSKAEVASRVSTETRVVIDGYRRMVTMHSYQKKRTLRPRGSPRAWAECGADASQHHPRPSAAAEAARQAQMLTAHRSPLLRPIRKRERHPGRYKTTGCNGPKLGRPHNGVPRMTG